jgi:cytochrome P450
MKALVNEIRSTFNTEEEITAQSAKSLVCLTTILQEGMRLCLPLSDNGYRTVPRGGATITGHHLPGGIIVGIPCYPIIRSETNFYSPKRFVPERWL